MKVERKTSFTQANKEVQYTHIKNGSEVICFMFSGAGYTYDKPLFYYSTMLMLENKIDVVQIHYSYNESERNLPINEFANMMVEDVTLVIKDVLDKDEYIETIFLGKSLGTIPIIVNISKDNKYQNSKIVLLTPLLKFDLFYEGLLEISNKTFFVIGEDDSHYINDRIGKLEEKTNLVIKKIKNSNHSLEVEPFNTFVSIKNLSEIMIGLNDFLNYEKV